MDNNFGFWFILLLILAIVLYVLYRKNFKILKVPSVCLITGGVKTGKTLLSVNLATKDYKRRYFKFWVKRNIFRDKKIEKPLFYTNSVSFSFGNRKAKKKHKLDKNIRYLNTGMLLRETRFNYGSVIFVQECSLLADNMDYNNKIRNIDLSLFNKLIAHETRGGAIYYDTQSILDSHYSIKRVTSTYLFIQKNVNFFLFHVLYVREMINSENGVNDFVDDIDTTTRKVLIPFWYHNRYDRYEFSRFTDSLDKGGDKNTSDALVSFNPLYIERVDKRSVIEKGGN